MTHLLFRSFFIQALGLILSFPNLADSAVGQVQGREAPPIKRLNGALPRTELSFVSPGIVDAGRSLQVFVFGRGLRDDMKFEFHGLRRNKESVTIPGLNPVAHCGEVVQIGIQVPKDVQGLLDLKVTQKAFSRAEREFDKEGVLLVKPFRGMPSREPEPKEGFEVASYDPEFVVEGEFNRIWVVGAGFRGRPIALSKPQSDWSCIRVSEHLIRMETKGVLPHFADLQEQELTLSIGGHKEELDFEVRSGQLEIHRLVPGVIDAGKPVAITVVGEHLELISEISLDPDAPGQIEQNGGKHLFQEGNSEFHSAFTLEIAEPGEFHLNFRHLGASSRLPLRVPVQVVAPPVTSAGGDSGEAEDPLVGEDRGPPEDGSWMERLLPSKLEGILMLVLGGGIIVLLGSRFPGVRAKPPWCRAAEQQWEKSARTELPERAPACQWTCRVAADLSAGDWGVSAIGVEALPLKGGAASEKRMLKGDALEPINNLDRLVAVLDQREEARDLLAPLGDSIAGILAVWIEEGSSPAAIRLTGRFAKPFEAKFELLHREFKDFELVWTKKRSWEKKLAAGEEEEMATLKGPVVGEDGFLRRIREECLEVLVDLGQRVRLLV